MLSVKAYKYLKGKYQQRNASRSPEEPGHNGTANSRPQDPTPGVSEPQVLQPFPQEVPRDPPQVATSVPRQAKSGKSSWKWKAVLMIGLAIPVFLETLDYTGTSGPLSQVHQLNYASSCRHCPDSYRGMLHPLCYHTRSHFTSLSLIVWTFKGTLSFLLP